MTCELQNELALVSALFVPAGESQGLSVADALSLSPDAFLASSGSLGRSPQAEIIRDLIKVQKAARELSSAISAAGFDATPGVADTDLKEPVANDTLALLLRKRVVFPKFCISPVRV